jgi:hypothetical protein
MDDGREHWSFVWRDELKFDGAGNVTHMLAPAVPRGNYHLVEDSDFIALPEGSAVAYRLWTPHPRASAIPDSPMLSTLDIARELLLLTSSVHATATSRLVRSKLLLMPQEISPGPIGMPGRSDDPLIDPFQRDLADHFDRALENPSEAASLSPYIIWAMSDYLKEIRDLTLHDTATDYLERDLRSETIKRLALGWDMPPEALMGLGGTNHWSAWAVREDMWVLHGAPIAEQFCDDIGEAYLRPALREEGYDGWEEVVVAYDETGVIVNPDRSKDADEAWDRGAISYAAYRNAKRFKETDEPPEEEYLNWLAIKLRDAAVSPDAAEEVGPGDVQAGPPPGEPGPVSEQTNLPEEAALWGAAQLAVLRCREMAGNRLRSRRDSCPECLEEMTEIPNTDLAATLSREAWAKLGMVDPAALVRGGADSFRLLALGWGMDEPSVTSLVARIEDHAARTLFDQKPSLLERA